MGGLARIADEEITPAEKKPFRMNSKIRTMPAGFSHEEEIDRYYNGFCNETIWPLFHYFTSMTKYEAETGKPIDR